MTELLPVVIDACVLYSAQLRDIVMELGVEGVIKPRWTDKIHDEWTGALVRNGKATAAQIARTRDLMQVALPDSMIVGNARELDGLALPDPNDRHVIEAAILAGASTIVTFNLKHFPAEVIAPIGIQCQHIDDFLVSQMAPAEAAVLVALRRLRGRLRRPPMSAQEYLQRLAGQQVPKFAKLLANFGDSL